MVETLRATRTSTRTTELSVRRGSLLLTALFLTACPVDDRLLAVSTGAGGETNHEAGAPSNGGTSGTAPAGGTANESGAAGQAGESAAGEGGALSFGDGCADLDQNHVSDCTETLVTNSGFKTDVASWTPETDASITWDPHDLLGSPGSGSALITSSVTVMAPGDSLVAAEQCVAVREGAILGIFGNARIDAGQGPGRAAVSLWFFTSDGCPGNVFSEAYETTEQFETGKLLTLQGSKVVPTEMRSVRVRLSVIKSNSAASFAVHFDNILLREE